MRKKKEDKSQGGLIAGFPLIAYQEFLCRRLMILENSEVDWFDLDHARLSFASNKPFDGAEEAMVARAWIEPVPTKSPTKRYRLTDAGKRFAADSQHLFKWPASNGRVRPAPTYSSRIECLMHLHKEFARVMGGDPERDLEVLRDLETGFDEEALANMFARWNYNIMALATRGGFVPGGCGEKAAAPRVDLAVFITSKGSLAVEWCPSGMEFDSLTPNCDWLRWRADKHRHMAFDSRPSNELLFIYGVQSLTRHFPGFYNAKWHNPDRIMVDAILLQGIAATVEELKSRLKYSFDVRMITDVFTEWEEVECSSWPDGKADVLASWKIENVAERNKRIEAAEAERTRIKQLQDIEQFEEVFGCPLEVFVKVVNEPDAKKATGPAPLPHTKSDRISRQLKKNGYAKMTLSTVEHCRTILERHRPDLLPPPPKPAEQATDLRAIVLPVTKANPAAEPSQ